MDLVLVLVFVVVFLASFLYLSRPKGLPPGPFAYPFVGSYPFLKQLQGRLSHEVYLEASKKYGNIFSFKLGPQTLVVLTGYDAVYQALVRQSDVFSDRPNFLPVTIESLKDGRGILLQTYNHQWKAMRRFTLQTLRDFGVGKSSLEEKIMIEVEAATRYLEEVKSEPTEMAALLQMMIGNVIYGIVFGKRYAYDDPEFTHVRTMTNIAISGQGLGSATNFFPKWFTKLFVRQADDTAVIRRANFKKVREFIADMIKQHEDTYDENNIRDFVDLYIQISKNEQEDTKEVFTMGNMRRVILDLFFAGSETTSTTLDWAFLYMAEFPEVQRRCQQEIEEVLGDKQIEYSDRTKLTFVEATTMEIQRLANIVPLSVTHATLVDTKLMGYNIPGKSFVIPNLYSVSLDPNHWEEPTKFNPDRFIDSAGKIIKKDAFMPFSIGPRTCLGEPLARMELFLVFVNLLQRFRFEREDPSVKHSMQPKLNQITNSPLPYKLRVTRR